MAPPVHSQSHKQFQHFTSNYCAPKTSTQRVDALKEQASDSQLHNLALLFRAPIPTRLDRVCGSWVGIASHWEASGER